MNVHFNQNSRCSTEKFIHDRLDDFKIKFSRKLFEIDSVRVIPSLKLTKGKGSRLQARVLEDPETQNTLNKEKN